MPPSCPPTLPLGAPPALPEESPTCSCLWAPHTPRALSSGSKRLALLLQLRSGNASIRIRPGPGGGRRERRDRWEGLGGAGGGLGQLHGEPDGPSSRFWIPPQAPSHAGHRLGFHPTRVETHPPPPAPPAPLELALLQCTAAMLGVGRSQAWSGLSPLFSAQLRARGPPACVSPPAQGGSGPSLSPAPKAAPWGRGGQCPPPPVAGTPSSRRLHGARPMSREGTCRWTQERGGVNKWERGGRE